MSISTMVDIARLSGQNSNPVQHRELDRLLADGVIEKIAAASNRAPATYAVTAKRQKILDDRGVGANES
jgi:hypothetical protein